MLLWRKQGAPRGKARRDYIETSCEGARISIINDAISISALWRCRLLWINLQEHNNNQEGRHPQIEPILCNILVIPVRLEAKTHLQLQVSRTVSPSLKKPMLSRCVGAAHFQPWRPSSYMPHGSEWNPRRWAGQSPCDFSALYFALCLLLLRFKRLILFFLHCIWNKKTMLASEASLARRSIIQ